MVAHLTLNWHCKKSDLVYNRLQVRATSAAMSATIKENQYTTALSNAATQNVMMPIGKLCPLLLQTIDDVSMHALDRTSQVRL